MPDPFSTEYAPPAPTATAKEVVASKSVAQPLPAEAAPLVPVTKAGATPFGFNPTVYGTGKPRRVVIRGKIARD